MLTEQLKTLYGEVFRNAAAIITHKLHFERFTSMGISENKFIQIPSPRLPADLFYPETQRKYNDNTCTVGVYGKTGRSKGTEELLKAFAILKEERKETRFLLKACWGGRDMEKTKALISELKLESEVDLNDFIPHWKIPEFIKSCDIIVLLENNFSISFHVSGIPLEVVSCGRMLLTTKEIAKKGSVKKHLRLDKDYMVTPTPLDPQTLACSLNEICVVARAREWDHKSYDTSLVSMFIYNNIKNKLTELEKKFRS